MLGYSSLEPVEQWYDRVDGEGWTVENANSGQNGYRQGVFVVVT